MIDVLLPVFSMLSLVIGIATLVVAALVLRSSRRSEEIGEARIELLRDQQERLELLREERKMLMQELERERRERSEIQRRLNRLRFEISEPEEHELLPALPQIDPAEHPELRKPWWRRLLRS